MNIVVTGTSKGIGKEICKQFSRDINNNIIAISRTQQNPFEGFSNIRYISFDLNNTHQLKKLVIDVMSTFSNVDILINNAGLLINKSIETLTPDDFDNLINTNLKSSFFLIQNLLPHFSKKSHIVNISSMGGYQGSIKFPGLSLYSTAKAGIAVLSECLAEELKTKDISCNALALGAVQTEMLSQIFPEYQAPLQPTEMSEFICNFSLTGHKFFNGKILPVSLSTP